MEAKPSIYLEVNGVPIVIDYVANKVGYPKELNQDKYRLARISSYVCDEGFLDDEFIALCKQTK